MIQELLRRQAVDFDWKWRLWLAMFICGGLPAAALSFFGAPDWVLLGVVATATLFVGGIWLVARVYDETGPWNVQQHVDRIAAEVEAELGQPGPAPPVETVDLSGLPISTVARLAELMSPGPDHRELVHRGGGTTPPAAARPRAHAS